MNGRFDFFLLAFEECVDQAQSERATAGMAPLTEEQIAAKLPAARAAWDRRIASTRAEGLDGAEQRLEALKADVLDELRKVA